LPDDVPFPLVLLGEVHVLKVHSAVLVLFGVGVGGLLHSYEMKNQSGFDPQHLYSISPLLLGHIFPWNVHIILLLETAAEILGEHILGEVLLDHVVQSHLLLISLLVALMHFIVVLLVQYEVQVGEFIVLISLESEVT
tara:strand:- start:74 stop:487 length:414 start_codon:yes stop_codon:yes gene_type:complete